MYHFCDHFWAPLTESRHFRSSIRRPVVKNRFQCNHSLTTATQKGEAADDTAVDVRACPFNAMKTGSCSVVCMYDSWAQRSWPL